MARKGTQPALYELIRSRPGQREATASSPTAGGSAALSGNVMLPPPAAAPSGGSSGAHAGQAGPTGALGGGLRAESDTPDHAFGGSRSQIVRVPVGYVYAAVAILLAAVVAGYLYGVSVGERIADDRLAQQRRDELNAAGRMPEIDPMNVGKVPPSLAASQGAGTGGGERSGAGAAGKQRSTSDRSDSPAGGGDEDLGPAAAGDPRQPELNYFILAHTPNRNGQAMVDFCRKNGLDAHLVPDDNAELRLVIVAPGFTSGDRQSAAVKALEKKIRTVGQKWKSAARGNRDFGDAYPSKYQGTRTPSPTS